MKEHCPACHELKRVAVRREMGGWTMEKLMTVFDYRVRDKEHETAVSCFCPKCETLFIINE